MASQNDGQDVNEQSATRIAAQIRFIIDNLGEQSAAPATSPMPATSVTAEPDTEATTRNHRAASAPAALETLLQDAEGQDATLEEQPRVNGFEAVIAGAQLPKTPGEAKNASETRYKRLLAQHHKATRAAGTTRADRARKLNDNVDFMPEFFRTENFTDDEEVNSVRCVCGVVADDGASMVSCDKCGVWQHIACVFNDKQVELKDKSYVCHVCDPFSHRLAVAGLRRDNPL